MSGGQVQLWLEFGIWKLAFVVWHPISGTVIWCLTSMVCFSFGTITQLGSRDCSRAQALGFVVWLWVQGKNCSPSSRISVWGPDCGSDICCLSTVVIVSNLTATGIPYWGALTMETFRVSRSIVIQSLQLYPWYASSLGSSVGEAGPFVQASPWSAVCMRRLCANGC